MTKEKKYYNIVYSHFVDPYRITKLSAVM